MSGSTSVDPVEWVRTRLVDGERDPGQVLEYAESEFRIQRVDLLVRVGRECVAEKEPVDPFARVLLQMPRGELAKGRDALRRAALVSRHPEWDGVLRVALARASEDPAPQLLSSIQEGAAKPLLQAMHLVQDPAFFDGAYPVLESAAPGGPLSFWLPVEAQRSALSLLARSPARREDAVEVFRRVARLSGDPAAKEIAGAALKEFDPRETTVAGAGTGTGEAGEPGAATGIDPQVMARGKEVYLRPGLCATCHLPNGGGMPGAFPPLVKSPWMGGDPDRMIKAVHGGLMGDIEINGEWFNNVMPPQGLLLNDEELAAVLTYVRNSWGNSASAITPEMVRRVAEENRGKVGMWTVEDLLKAHPLEEASSVESGQELP